MKFCYDEKTDMSLHKIEIAGIMKKEINGCRFVLQDSRHNRQRHEWGPIILAISRREVYTDL